MKYATKKLLRDYTVTVTLAVGLAILIRTYLFEAYRIPNQSMNPALLAGDTIFVAKWPQKLNKNILPERGDIVVFKTTPKGPDFIRRVVGLPGDTLALKSGHLFLNGISLLAPIAASAPCFREQITPGTDYQICLEAPLLPDFGPEKVPENSLFVLEDSRAAIQKNPIRGIIPLESIQGKALWIWLSIQGSGELPDDLNGKLNGHFSWLPRFRLERMFRHI